MSAVASSVASSLPRASSVAEETVLDYASPVILLISHACETCLGLEDSLEAFVEGRGFFCADGSVSGDSGRGL